MRTRFRLLIAGVVLALTAALHVPMAFAVAPSPLHPGHFTYAQVCIQNWGPTEWHRAQIDGMGYQFNLGAELSVWHSTEYGIGVCSSHNSYQRINVSVVDPSDSSNYTWCSRVDVQGGYGSDGHYNGAVFVYVNPYRSYCADQGAGEIRHWYCNGIGMALGLLSFNGTTWPGCGNTNRSDIEVPTLNDHVALNNRYNH